MSFYNEYNLLNAHEEENVSENTLLFSVTNLILSNILKKDTSEQEADIISFIEKLRNSKTNRFNNLPRLTIGKDKYISHDQFTSLCAFSAHYGLDYHTEMWNKIIYMTYDNISGEFNIKRFIHPRDYIYIGYLNDNKICKALMPLFCLITVITFITKYKVRPTFFTRLKTGFKEPKRRILKTDGILLTLVRAFGLKKRSKLFNFTYKVCLKILNYRFDNGFKDVFSIYYNKEHPNNELSQLINNYKVD